VGAKETPLGLVPDMQGFDTSGLDIPGEKLMKLFEIDKGSWKEELQDIEKFLDRFGDRLPSEIRQEHNKLKKQLT
jgi:phosphoenolpyruvate carboxykinase (GTP)